MDSTTCCIFNLAPHYNAPIYTLMDKEFNCDFYLGDRISYPIELMNYESLKGFKKTLNFKSLVGNFYYQQGAIRLAFKSYKYYIITGEPFCISTWLILLVNILRGKKTYLWTHGWYGNEDNLKIILKKMFFGLSDKVLLYGDYARKMMIDEGFNPEKLIPVYNSLDYENQIRIRENLKKTSIFSTHYKNDNPVLIYIGRIQSRKKIELLIETLNRLHKNKTNCNLIIIGKQTDQTNIQNLISLYGLEKYIWLFGPCYDENVLGELIYNANLCVVPGDIGLTVMHSFVYGTPIVTHDNFQKHGPEFEAIEPHVTGDFFIENSIEDLCIKIKYWISVDKNKRESIRLKCYKIIEEKYNPKKQIEILKKIFQN